ncbi:MAG: hypothetical protein FWD23_08305 [Oscillospiraceae bacterium]|nr:hypothetical protein [Oscillospiraceae bacterium]
MKTKNLTRIMVLILFLTLAFTVVLASCNNSGDNKPEEKKDAANPDVSESADATEETALYDEVPELDFGGYEYRVVVGTYNLRNETLYPEADIGEVLNDAIYARNKSIENRFNIKFNAAVIDLFQLLATLRKNTKAGTDAYDMYMQIDREAHQAAGENMLYPIDQLPYIDLTRLYWSPVTNKQLTIGGKLYWAFSDDMLSSLEATVVTFFNKKQIQDLGLEDPYALVRAGTWTHDKLFEMAKSAARDIDGDGKMTEADNWGILSEHYYIAQSFWVSAGVCLIEKDKDDIPYFAVPGNQRFFDIADRAITGLNSKDGVFMETIGANLPSHSGDSSVARKIAFFKNGQCLFSVGAIPETIDLRDMSDDFGIIPFPKFTADQESYYSSVCGGFPFIIPNLNSNIEVAGAVMEAMACSARNKIIPAYYEMALKNKYSRDGDTAEMLDLIYNSRVYDLGATIWPESGTDYTYAFVKSSNTFASLTEKNADKYNRTIQKAVENILSE